jgi:hypothetical protein
MARQWPCDSDLLRKRASVFGVIGWLAVGDAVTMVPGPATGAGSELSGRNSGWIRSWMELRLASNAPGSKAGARPSV